VAWAWPGWPSGLLTNFTSVSEGLNKRTLKWNSTYLLGQILSLFIFLFFGFGSLKGCGPRDWDWDYWLPRNPSYSSCSVLLIYLGLDSKGITKNSLQECLSMIASANDATSNLLTFNFSCGLEASGSLFSHFPYYSILNCSSKLINTSQRCYRGVVVSYLQDCTRS
jgi:hypothetical protein